MRTTIFFGVMAYIGDVTKHNLEMPIVLVVIMLVTSSLLCFAQDIKELTK